MTEFTKTLRILLPFGLCYFMGNAVRSINAILAPTFMHKMNISPSALGLMTALFLLATAVMQVPMGMAFDKFSARMVQTVLYLIAAVGTFIFAAATNYTELVIGRIIAGIGFAGLVAGFLTANEEFFPKEVLAKKNSVVFMLGSFGVIFATLPAERIIHSINWHDLCYILAAGTLMSAIITWLFVPKINANELSDETFKQNLSGYVTIIKSFNYWRIALFMIIPYASYLAIQTLWVGPWLHEVIGLSQHQLSFRLFALACGMPCGYFACKYIPDIAKKFNASVKSYVFIAILLSVIVQVLIVTLIDPGSYALWFLYGFLVQITSLIFATLGKMFDPRLAGRVNTLTFLLLMITTFVFQYCFGAIVEAWPKLPNGFFPTIGYKWVLGSSVILNSASLLWYAITSWIHKKHQ